MAVRVSSANTHLDVISNGGCLYSCVKAIPKTKLVYILNALLVDITDKTMVGLIPDMLFLLNDAEIVVKGSNKCDSTKF